MWILIALLVAVLLIGVLIYNGLVAKKNQVEYAFAGMDAMLKKRYDLIPNLVASVKQYAKHEQDTLTRITELRSRAVAGGLSESERVEIDKQLTKAVSGLMVAVEAYPELKANENFLQLQRSLNEVEEQISAARRAYNASVTDYNNALEMFPSNLVAGMLGYKRRALFEIPEAERGNVNVSQLFGN